MNKLTANQKMEMQRDQFIKDLIPIIKEKGYLREEDEKDIKYRGKLEHFFFDKKGWYYTITIHSFPANPYRQEAMHELRVRRESCVTGRFVRDEFDERCWIYLDKHFVKYNENNHINKCVDGYVFNYFQRLIMGRDWCPICEKYTRSRSHERCQFHKRNLQRVIKANIDLPLDIQKYIAEYV